VIFTDKAIITILECNIWDEIKRHIYAKMRSERQDECFICSNEIIQKCRISCPKCASYWCLDCYISIFRTNKGVIKCPFCRFTYGQKFPDYMIEMGIKEILHKVVFQEDALKQKS
jgi:hypothetical protein